MRKSGFAVLEIAVALLLLGFLTVIVGSLLQQVMYVSKSAKQTSVVIALRSKINTISRNPSQWLNSMRGFSGVYGGCIPNYDTVNSITNYQYTCPQVDDTLLEADPNLKQLAGNLHAVSEEIVDSTGEKIAGTLSNPLYLNEEGRACTESNSSTRCPIKSIGYFLRQNTTSNPGDVKFVVKIERNPASINTANITPMKAQYMTIDIGNEWRDGVAHCPTGTVKMGYLSSGKLNCISLSKDCSSGEISVGVDNKGDPICKSVPSCEVNYSVALNNQTNEPVCTSASLCPNNQIFLGYYQGSGDPICTSPTIKCESGSLQVGIELVNNQLKAKCEVLPSCQDSQMLRFEGSKFVCEESTPKSCATNEYQSGTNAQGAPICKQVNNEADNDKKCANGEHVTGIKGNGDLICTKTNSPTIYSGTSYVGFYNGQPHSVFTKVSLPSPQCPAGTSMKIFVQSKSDSILCGDGSGPTICSSDPGQSSQDIHAYAAKVDASSFNVYLSGTNGVWVGNQSPSFGIEWAVICQN